MTGVSKETISHRLTNSGVDSLAADRAVGKGKSVRREAKALVTGAPATALGPP